MSTMTTDKDDLEALEPSTAQQLFLDHKETSCAEATVQNYRYRTNAFVEWCETEGIDNLNDLSGRDIQQYRLWRKDDGDLNKVTLRMQMSTIRVFLKWAGRIEAVPENLYDKVMVPRVRPEERQRDETLDAETAQKILDHLVKYQYASLGHALLSILWETGIRIGAAVSLDVESIDFDNGHIQLEHRPEEGTPLKNGQSGERLIAITAALEELLADYIQDRRHEITDDYGREPLFTSRQGRMCDSSLRRTVYRITAPCFRDEHCPDCKNANPKCPESLSPHDIRRGSITHFLSNDVPVNIISDRMNVSRKILKQHYDQRSAEVKLEQRRGYLDNL